MAEVLSAARSVPGPDSSTGKARRWSAMGWLGIATAVMAWVSMFLGPLVGWSGDGGGKTLWVLVAGAGLGSGVLAVFLWQRYWRLVDTPTLDLSGLRPGPVEVTGRLTTAPGQPLFTSPTGVATCFGRVSILVRSGSSHTLLWSAEFGSVDLGLSDGSATVKMHGWASRFLTQRRRTVVDLHGHRFVVREQLCVPGPKVTVLGHATFDGHQVALAPPEGVLGPNADTGAVGSEAQTRTRQRRVAQGVTSGSVAALLWCAVLEVRSVEGSPDAADAAQDLVLRDASLAVAAGFTAVLAMLVTTAYGIRLFNRVLGCHQQTRAAWSWIGVELVGRHAALLNLVPTVRAAFAHESTVLSALDWGPPDLSFVDPDVVPDARMASAVDSGSRTDRDVARTVLGLVETNAELHAGASADLFSSLVLFENRIAAARRFYNDAVRSHRELTGVFPGALLRPVTPPAGHYLDLGLGAPGPPAVR